MTLKPSKPSFLSEDYPNVKRGENLKNTNKNLVRDGRPRHGPSLAACGPGQARPGSLCPHAGRRSRAHQVSARPPTDLLIGRPKSRLEPEELPPALAKLPSFSPESRAAPWHHLYIVVSSRSLPPPPTFLLPDTRAKGLEEGRFAIIRLRGSAQFFINFSDPQWFFFFLGLPLSWNFLSAIRCSPHWSRGRFSRFCSVDSPGSRLFFRPSRRRSIFSFWVLLLRFRWCERFRAVLVLGSISLAGSGCSDGGVRFERVLVFFCWSPISRFGVFCWIMRCFHRGSGGKEAHFSRFFFFRGLLRRFAFSIMIGVCSCSSALSCCVLIGLSAGVICSCVGFVSAVPSDSVDVWTFSVKLVGFCLFPLCCGFRWVKMSSRLSRTIYVGNLPGDIRKREIEDLFYKVRLLLHKFFSFFHLFGCCPVLRKSVKILFIPNVNLDFCEYLPS